MIAVTMMFNGYIHEKPPFAKYMAGYQDYIHLSTGSQQKDITWKIHVQTINYYKLTLSWFGSYDKITGNSVLAVQSDY